MPVRLVDVVFVAADPEQLAEDWSSEFDFWDMDDEEGGEFRLVPDETAAEEEGSLRLAFVPGPKPPKVGKNRIHVDLNTHDMFEYDRRLSDTQQYTETRPLDIGQGDLVPWVVYPDVEGNEYCVLKPRDRYERSGAVAAVVFDCADPATLAAFWSEVTGWPIVDNEPDFAALREPEPEWGEGPFIEFLRNADRNPQPAPIWLSLEGYYPHQHDADVQRLVELGATVVRKHEGEVSYTVLADPEGNEFRVVVAVWPPPKRTYRWEN